MNGKYQLRVYADAVNMLGENLQTIRGNTERACKDVDLEVNSEQQNIEQNQNIVIENLLFEKVEKFKYLGLTVTNTNDIPKEIKRRMNMGNACYY